MSCYRHLSIIEREKLSLYLAQGLSQREIARRLGRAPSTISREVRRSKGLLPWEAQTAYQERRRRCVRRYVLSDPELEHLVRFWLGDLHWSPEQIAGRLRMETKRCVISTSTIYRALDKGLLRDTLRIYLRRKYKKIGKSKKKDKSCFHRSIEERSRKAGQRRRVGDFEGDTIVSRRGRAVIVTATDRMSRFLVMGKVEKLDAGLVREKLADLLKGTKQKLRSVTLDRGTEFTQGRELEEELKVPVYFTHPHSPWEKPTVENTNGLLRQFIPKRQSLDNLTEEELDKFCALLNFRPRKCLNWRSPYEIHYSLLLHFT